MSLSAYYAALAALMKWTAEPSPESAGRAAEVWAELVRLGYARRDRVPTSTTWPTLLQQPEGGTWTWRTLAEWVYSLTPAGGALDMIAVATGEDPREIYQTLLDAVEEGAENVEEGLERAAEWLDLLPWALGLGLLALLWPRR